MINKSGKINWYGLNRSLHRDIGYFCIGMMLVFAVSGIAVNHKDDWNPNYQVKEQVIQLPVFQWQQDNDEILTKQILSFIDHEVQIKATYWAAPNKFKIFLKNDGSINVNFEIDELVYERIVARPFFQAINRLHLNETHTAWVIFSDLFSGLFIFLAISALFMVKGKNSAWRGKFIIVLLGFLIPFGFIFW